MTRYFAAIIALLALLAGSAFTQTGGSMVDAQGTPAPVSSVVFAQAEPAPVENPVLAFAQVTIPVGASIDSHHHPGTQIGEIASGVLTYTVETGVVQLRRAGSKPEDSAQEIVAGETVELHPGDTLIEPPTSIHHAQNLGDEDILINLSTLFPKDAPRAIYVDEPTEASATPTI